MAAPAERHRPWGRLQADLFRFATTELYDLHVALMCVFEDAAVLQPALGYDHVRAGLADLGWDEPLDDERLNQALGALAKWGLLDVSQNHTARFATPEEFERRNLQWSLTPEGQAAIGGVLHALSALRHVAGLQPAVIDAIADGLGELRRLLDDPAAPPGRLKTRLDEVEAHLASLVGNVRQFNTRLQRLLRDDGAADEVFLDVKQRTVTYLQQYIQGVERPTRRVRLNVEALAAAGVESLFERALEGANLAPLPDGDPSPLWLTERRRRWDALRAWFAPVGTEEPKIGALVAIARQAILQLMRVLERRWEARRRSASITEDFRALGRLFAEAPDEASAHQLFNAAFGLWPSRHAHLACPDEEAVASSTPWTDGPAVPVAPVFRVGAAPAQLGRSHPVADTRLLRAARQQEQALALARNVEVRRSLATGGTVRMSQFFGLLSGAAFTELLELLSQALSAPLASDGTRRATSADGGVEIVLAHPTDGHLARIATEAGILTSPDFLLSILVTGYVPAAAEELEATGA